MDISWGIVTQFLKRILGPLWDSWQFWRGINREHDVEVFRKLDSIANEALVDDILNRRIYTSSFRLEDDHLLADLIEALNRIENRYLDRTLQKRVENLAQKISVLLAFVQGTFWSVKDGWLKFRPDPIDPKVYDSEWKELCLKIDVAWDAYKTYRMTAKERLRV